MQEGELPFLAQGDQKEKKSLCKEWKTELDETEGDQITVAEFRE